MFVGLPMFTYHTISLPVTHFTAISSTVHTLAMPESEEVKHSKLIKASEKLLLVNSSMFYSLFPLMDKLTLMEAII